MRLLFSVLLTEDNYYILFITFLLLVYQIILMVIWQENIMQTSQIGEILDPIADKILIVFILLGLSVNLSSYLIGFLSFFNNFKRNMGKCFERL